MERESNAEKSQVRGNVTDQKKNLSRFEVGKRKKKYPRG